MSPKDDLDSNTADSTSGKLDPGNGPASLRSDNLKLDHQAWAGDRDKLTDHDDDKEVPVPPVQQES